MLIYVLICALLVWVYVSFFPTMQEQADEFMKLLSTYPEGLLEAFGLESAESIFSSLEAFLSTEQYSLIWPLVAIILTVTMAASLIAGEVDDGTAEILLAQPISRTKVYWGKYIAGFLIILVFTFFSVFSVIPFGMLHNVDVNLEGHFLIAILGILFSTAIFSITMMFSSIFSSKGKVASLGAGITIIMYALNIISSLKESAESLKYISFFHYFDTNAALIHNNIEPLAFVIFLTVSIVCSVVGWVVFVKRDVAT